MERKSPASSGIRIRDYLVTWQVGKYSAAVLQPLPVLILTSIFSGHVVPLEAAALLVEQAHLAHVDLLGLRTAVRRSWFHP